MWDVRAWLEIRRQSTRSVVDEVQRALAMELLTASDEDLPRLDERIRARSRSMALEPADAGLTGLHALGFSSFSPNGFEREKAVERLAASEDDAALRYLILRMTDWVPQVRERARRAVIRRMSAQALVDHFLLLSRAARADAELLQQMARLAADERAHRAMLERAHGDTGRAMYRFLLDSVPEARQAAIEAGASSNDSVIRTWVTPLLNDLPVLLRLASDRVPAVRTRALRALAESFPDEAKGVLEGAILDRSTAVRDLARFLLGPRDHAATYRDALAGAQTARSLSVALAGLAETGKAGDADIAAALLDHPTAAVRRAAVKCAMRLAGDTFAERVTAMLADGAPGVSAAARDALRKRDLDRTALVKIFGSTHAPHVRRNAVSLFAALPKWQSIIALLTAVAAGEDASRFIEAWNRNYNQGQMPPSRRELEEVHAAFEAAGPALDRATREAIRFTISQFGARS